jgi:hypothetical protein
MAWPPCGPFCICKPPRRPPHKEHTWHSVLCKLHVCAVEVSSHTLGACTVHLFTPPMAGARPILPRSCPGSHRMGARVLDVPCMFTSPMLRKCSSLRELHSCHKMGA